MKHAYIGERGFADACLFSFGESGMCGLPRLDPLHEVEDGVTISSSDAPTERLEFPDPTNAMGPDELDLPRTRSRSREAGNEFADGRGRSFAEKPLWRVAAAALVSDTGSVVSGPWPVRKLMMYDDPGELADQQGQLEMVMDALFTTGVDYLVSVWRPDGAEYRFACVTWGWAAVMSLSDIADEIALRWDR